MIEKTYLLMKASDPVGGNNYFLIFHNMKKIYINLLDNEDNEYQNNKVHMLVISRRNIKTPLC